MNSSKPSRRESLADNPLEPLVDVSECSRITGRSIPSLNRDRMLGVGIPYIKFGFLIRYEPSAIRDFIERNRCGGRKETK
jgi:hypothetical protein